MIIEYPAWLLLLVVLGGVIFWRRKRLFQTTISFPNLEILKQISTKQTAVLIRLMTGVRYLILLLIILALANPQGVSDHQEITSEGIDIVLTVDVSETMAAEDFTPNRLTIAKSTMAEFIEKRTSDRIGVVVFAEEAYTQCPLTLDHSIVTGFIDKIDFGIAGSGTAIGTAIATSLNRLKASKSPSRIIILLTDGENNHGQIDPITASTLAKDLGVKIYVIGVGKSGGAPVPYNHPRYGKQYYKDAYGKLLLTSMDEESLEKIAATTGGAYFRAEDEKALSKIYKNIDLLEKSENKIMLYKNYKDYFPILILWAFILLVVEILISNTILVTVP
jgi:Ca-activated chloride channel homolog